MENNWKFHHVIVIVRDMDKAVEYYQSLGTATFQPEYTVTSNQVTNLKVYGKTPDTEFKIKVKEVQVGSLSYEFFEPVEGQSFLKEFLDSKGEGIYSVAFIVDDLEKETDALVKKGVPVIRKSRLT